MKILCLISLSFLVLICMASQLSAAGHAIRIGCTNNGDGTTWNCATTPGGTGAYNEIPATLTRGDIYYFSKGTLIVSNYRLDDPENGTLRITFKKATDADYGGLAGWDTTLGNAQTIFSSPTNDPDYNVIFNGNQQINNGYYKFDGVYGTGSNPDSYGFKFIPGTLPGPNTIRLFYGWDVNRNCEFYHCAFVGPYPITSQCSGAFMDAGDGWTVQYCLFQGFDNAFHGATFNTTIDHCWFTQAWAGGAPGCHGQQISYNQDNLTVSNSVFMDSCYYPGTAFISFNDARNPGFGANGWKIYNNVFYHSCYGANRILTNSSSGQTCITNLEFNNNTIVDGGGKVDTSWGTPHVCDGSYTAYNNLFYNAFISFESTGSGQIHDYTYFDSTCTGTLPTGETHYRTETIAKTDLFVDPANYNYRLKRATSAAVNNGVALSSPYNVDADGVSRPQGSGWDMGAYEYAGTGDTIAPKAPTNLRIQ